MPATPRMINAGSGGVRPAAAGVGSWSWVMGALVLSVLLVLGQTEGSGTYLRALTQGYPR
jgi:hypothetical protein